MTLYALLILYAFGAVFFLCYIVMDMLCEPLAFLIFAVFVVGIFALVYAVLSASFLRMVTVKRGAAQIRYKESRLCTSSEERALLRREWVRFYRSPVYLLNCGLGSLLMLIMGIFAAKRIFVYKSE